MSVFRSGGHDTAMSRSGEEVCLSDERVVAGVVGKESADCSVVVCYDSDGVYKTSVERNLDDVVLSNFLILSSEDVR